MIIVNLNGGLGNQMFQYAMGKSLSIDKGVELRLYPKEAIDRNAHNGFELKDVFNVTANIATDYERKSVLGLRHGHKIIKLLRSKKLDLLRGKRYIVEKHFHYSDSVTNTASNIFFRGFWQSEKYFSNNKSDILSEFSFKKPLSQENTKIANQIQAKTSISIHVRRGDYVSNKVLQSLDFNYYKIAIRQLKLNKSNSLLVFFSDDIVWVKNNIIDQLSNDYQYIMISNNKGNESYNDMHLMSLCDHNIIANSSFSWWGAWLNQNPNKKIVAPKKWFLIDKNTSDLCPHNWIKI